MVVREDHSQTERTEPENLIVCINQKNGEEVLVVRIFFYDGGDVLVKQQH